MNRPRPTPPYPGQIRRPTASFGWLDTDLLHSGTLAWLGSKTTSVLLLLALAADEQGASYYSRGKMGAMLGMDMESVIRALDRLIKNKLVAFRPWRPGIQDGVWQLLPLKQNKTVRQGACLSVGQILNRLGLGGGDRGR